MYFHVNMYPKIKVAVSFAQNLHFGFSKDFKVIFFSELGKSIC